MLLTTESRKLSITILLVALSIAMSACAALQPLDASGPRANLPPYPIIANEPARLDSAQLTWKQISQHYALTQNTVADLQPLTGTIRSLPPNLGSSVFLPKVGVEATQSEEEIRESLRRFIVDWQGLIGADPAQLSLVDRTDDASGLRTAHYRQRPFRNPLRGEFGNLTIRFQSDRKVVDVTSTCLPNTDRLQAALANLTPQITAENAVSQLKQSTFNLPASSGQTASVTLPANAVVEVRQLVDYALNSSDKQSVELHIAWEIDVTNGPIKRIYLDAISGQVLAAN
jgi:hypothetical protein